MTDPILKDLNRRQKRFLGHAWKVTVPLVVLAVGALLAVFEHPVLGGEVSAAGLMMLRETLRH